MVRDELGQGNEARSLELVRGGLLRAAVEVETNRGTGKHEESEDDDDRDGPSRETGCIGIVGISSNTRA